MGRLAVAAALSALLSAIRARLSRDLTVPRLFMERMPIDWQRKMARLLHELDATFDWRPEAGQYWVRLRIGNKLYKPEDSVCDYRRGNVDHLRKNP